MRVPVVLALFRVGCTPTPTGPDPCVQQLVEDDAALHVAYEAYLQMHPSPAKIAQLEELFAQEEALFARVHQCDFGDDRSAYNRWYRSRMKFPSDIRADWLYLHDHGTLRPDE